VPAIRDRHGWDVDIWYPERAGGRLLPDAGFELTPGSGDDLRDYDAVVYNLGDHGGYHGALVDLCDEVPGTVVLHDLALTNMVLGRLLSISPAAAAHELSRWYETGSDRAASEIAQDPGGWAARTQSVTQFPLTELAVSGALGVVTHSRFAASRLSKGYVGDIWVLPLPALHFDTSEVEDVDLPMLDERQVVLQAGVLNSNKCVPTVVEAFAQAGISDRAQLVICGYAEPGDLENLHRDVQRRNLSDSVKVLGPVSDATLHALRQRALIATVLRDPCIEAASAVLLDSMAYGLAVVSVEGGHYAEVPADTVARVALPPRFADVAAILRRWIDEPNEARELGVRARAYVGARHTSAAYADGIVEAVAASGAMPRRRMLATQLSMALVRVGFTAEDAIANRVSAVAAELFSRHPEHGDALYSRV
jgi:glycosyltransferase involved in cell wall biosynthesis